MNRRNSRDGTNVRLLRVGELVRHALVDIFRRDSILDEDLIGKSITVSEARISRDLRHGTIFVIPLAGENQDEIVSALNRNSGYIRGQLAKAVKLRVLPKLKFELDKSFDQADKMESLLLESLAREGSEDLEANGG